MLTKEQLATKAAKIRLDSLRMISQSGKGATGSSMSIVDILVGLYYGEIVGREALHFDPAKPGWDGQDYLVLSKSQAAAVWYAILADCGFFDQSELAYFAKPGSILTEKPNGKVPGVSASVSGPGHGLSVALGIALSLKMERKNNRVYAVLGDGELQCGQVWEAAMAASHYKLNNLIAIVDNNKIQANMPINSVMDLGYIQDKFESFGWQVIQVTNGHDFDRILDAVNKAFTSNRRPVCLWCHTVAGKGVEFAEGKASYQNVPLSDGEFAVVEQQFKKLILAS